MTQRQSRLSGWSRSEQSSLGWRRSRDWAGWHTALAVAIGVALPLTIGILSGAFGVGEDIPDLTGDDVALEERYRELWTEIMEREHDLAYAERLHELVVDDEQSVDSAWATGFEAGWVEGQHDAAAAMREAAVEQELGDHRVEWQVLARLERSLPPRQ